MNLYDAGVFFGVLKIAIFEGSGFLGYEYFVGSPPPKNDWKEVLNNFVCLQGTNLSISFICHILGTPNLYP